MKLSAHITGPPIPQGSKRVLGGRVVDANASRLRPWRDSVRWAVAEATPPGWRTDQVYRVELEFMFPRPRFHHRGDGTLMGSAPFHKATRPDLDKLCRAVLDACTDAGIWVDDSRVVGLSAVKVYAPQGGLSIVVHSVAP